MGARSKKSWLSSLVDRAVAAVDVIDFSGQLRAERVYQAAPRGARLILHVVLFVLKLARTSPSEM